MMVSQRANSIIGWICKRARQKHTIIEEDEEAAKGPPTRPSTSTRVYS